VRDIKSVEVTLRSNQQFSVILSDDMADLVRAKVQCGDYASEGEVIQDGLRMLQAHDETIEKWLRDVAVPAYDALKADPSRAVPLAQVRARLQEEHRKTTAIQ
jgi:putative addiction module CopG family antidote